MKNNSYELTVLVNDRAITEYQHEGSTFIEGRKGSDFKVRFRNNTWKTVLVVPSVDGKSVITGDRATVNSRGYVVGARQSVDIPGWTLDNENIAKFTFDDKEKSYSAQTAEEGEEVITGVIGVLVFEEKPKPVEINQISSVFPSFPSPSYPKGVRGAWSMDNAAMGGSITADSANTLRSSVLASSTDTSVTLTASAPSATPYEMGTGFGAKEEFKTTTVNFERGAMSAMSLYYDSRRNLEKRGIKVVHNEIAEAPLPSAFAGVTGCKPPKGWNG